MTDRWCTVYSQDEENEPVKVYHGSLKVVT